MKNHISSVTLADFNKQSVTRTFAPGLNIIVGPNGSGKTSIWQAIELATTGKVTGLPKQNKAIMDACGSKLTMAVSIDAWTGKNEIVNRTFKRTKTGVTSTTTADKDKPLISPVCLSIDAFTAATAKERAAMIVGACGSDLTAIIETTLRESGLKGYVSIPPTDSVSEWIEAVNEVATDRAKMVRAEVEAMKGTLRGVETLEADPPVWSGPSLADLNSAIAQCRKEINQLQGQRSIYSRTSCPVEPTTIETIAFDLADEARFINEIETIRKQLATATAEARDMETWKTEHERITANIARAEAELKEIPETFEVSVISANEATARAELAKIKQKLADGLINPLANVAFCPCCGSPSSAWDVLKMAEAPTATVIQNWEAEVESLNELIQEHQESMFYDIARGHAKKNVTNWKEMLNGHSLRQPAPPTLTAEEFGKLKAREIELDLTIKEIQATRATAGQWADYRRNLAIYDKGLGEIKHIDSKIDFHESEAANLEAKRALASESAQARADIEARTRLREDATKRLEEKEADLLELVTATTKFNADLKARLGESLRPVIDQSRLFGRNLFPSELTVNDSLEIGYMDGLTWTSYDAMNASNKRIATIAIQSALSSGKAGIKAVCIDEFGVVDLDRQAQVLDNLNEACESGMLDQVIVIDNRMPHSYSKYAYATLKLA